VLIRASKTMAADQCRDAAAFMADLGVACPAPADLAFGGVIGSVLFTDIVTAHTSPWFVDQAALVLADTRPERFLPAIGQLGLFRLYTKRGSAQSRSAVGTRPSPEW